MSFFNAREGINIIQLDKAYFDELTKEKIQHLLELAQPYFDYRKYMYYRYTRKNNPTDIVGSAKKKVVAMFENYIVTMVCGYNSGKAPTYTVKESELSVKYQEAIDYIRRYNDDAAKLMEFMRDYLITAAAYLYIYEDTNNEVAYKRCDSRNTICFCDHYDYPTALMTVWTEKDKPNEETKKIEIITDKLRRIYNENGEMIQFNDYGIDGKLQSMTEKKLFWGDVPVVSFEQPDNMACFESVITQIDEYEIQMTHIRDTTQYNDNAKLKIVGYNPENEPYEEVADDKGNITRIRNPARIQEDKDLYEAATLFLDKDGDVEWMLKDPNYSGILSIVKQIHDLITMLTGVPNMTDEAFTSANNASALGFKLYPLNQYSSTTDRIFKEGYLRLWEIITNRLNLKGANYSFRDIDIVFNRNVPTDKDKETQRAITLYNAGIISLETAINMSGIDIDAKSEMARIEAEQADEYEKIQKHIKSGGKNDESQRILDIPGQKTIGTA